MGERVTDDRETTVSRQTRKIAMVVGVCLLAAIHFTAFYWSTSDYTFNGDDMMYFSRSIDSVGTFLDRLLTVDQLYLYRPLTYIVFSFMLEPLFGTNPSPYHLFAYLFTLFDLLLICWFVYLWTGRRLATLVPAALYIVLSPLHVGVSYGLGFLEMPLSVFLYFSCLIILINDRRRWLWTMPFLFVLALMSKEHSVMLPFHAVLVLISMDVPWRTALRRTRTLWAVLALFMTFQLVIREGDLFPNSETHMLRFTPSMERIAQLANNSERALAFPRRLYPHMSQNVARAIRFLLITPWIVMLIVNLRRRDRKALAGVVWGLLSVAPIAFIAEAPGARHYYLALPGIAIFFGSVVQSPRLLAFAVPVLVVSLATNVVSDVVPLASTSAPAWFVDASHETQRYLQSLRVLIDTTGRKEFYVLKDADSGFAWSMDDGRAIERFLGPGVSMHFQSKGHDLPVDRLLSNQLSVITAREGQIYEDLVTGMVTSPGQSSICDAVYKLMEGAEGCLALTQGVPIPRLAHPDYVSARNPFAYAGGKVLTASPMTLIVRTSKTLRIRKTASLSPESRDGVIVELYAYENGTFDLIQSHAVLPGETVRIDATIDESEAEGAILCIRRGPGLDQEGDLLVWNLEDSSFQ